MPVEATPVPVSAPTPVATPVAAPTKHKKRKLFLFVLAIAIVVGIVIYFNVKKTPSTPIILNGNHIVESKIELYPETDYKKGDKSAAYPSYIEITNIKDKTQYDNILVKSLKVKNCKIILFSENNYTGKTMLIDDKYNGKNTLRSEPLLEGFKSVSIEPYYQNDCELFTGCDFKDVVQPENNSELKIISQDFAPSDAFKYRNIDKKRQKNIKELVKIYDTLIKSVRSYGFILTLYTEPNFKGKETVLSDDIIYKACLSESARSIKIEPKT
jgi:hypothetical protein